MAKDFKNEKAVEEYILNNVKSFCEDILEDKYISAHSQYSYGKTRKYGAKRVDIYLECEKNDYLIEIKNPTNISENISAVGQLLGYGVLHEDYKPTRKKGLKLLIVSTKEDDLIVKTIKKYKLPITFMVISKDWLVIYK